MIDLTCKNCGRVFSRKLAEHKRNQRRGRRVFCSLHCSTSWIAKNLPPLGFGPHPEALIADNKRDKYTPFRYFLKICRNRKQRKGKAFREYNLDLAYLEKLWTAQNGHCPITGWELVLPHGTSGFDGGKQPRNASIDRIDHSQGYMKGNVRYVALIANLARSNWNDGAVIEMAQAIVNHIHNE